MLNPFGLGSRGRSNPCRTQGMLLVLHCGDEMKRGHKLPATFVPPAQNSRKRSLHVKRLLPCFLSVASLLANAQQDVPLYRDASKPAAARAHDLVSRMTLEEKASQLEDWAPAIPRLGIPEYQTWNEALHGVARAGAATVFPQAIGMAATWDPEVVRQMGDVIANEGRAKFNQARSEGNRRIFYGITYWSPNINIFRDPRWGRGQETYGEDPFLTGQLGSAFITGVQGTDPEHPKAVATSKHFAVHSGPESLRHGFNVNVSRRDLEETYLPAFRTTVVDGHVKSVMCAYNAIDGNAACSNKMLLQDHLRGAWGFKGFVVSDCGAIVDVAKGHHNAPDVMHAAAISLQTGTDLSCSIWTPGFNTLTDAVHQHLASEEEVTRAAERLYTARFELGMFDAPGTNPNDRIPPSAIASDEHRATALRAAEESIVLLKNSNVLPLTAAPHSIAVVGPTADLLTALEGNYNGQPIRPVSPLDGIIQQFSSSTIHYAQGATLAEGTVVPVPRSSFPSGLSAEFFASPDWTGKAVATTSEKSIQYDWQDLLPVPALHTHNYSVRWSGKLQVPAAGKYSFTVSSPSSFPYSPKQTYRVSVDGKVVSEGVLTSTSTARAPGASPTAPPVMSGDKKGRFEFTFPDTQPHDLRFEYSHSENPAGGGVTLSWNAPADAQLTEAVNAARNSDVVVAFVGLSPELEGEEMPIKIQGFEGGDRTSINLPQPQQRMLEALSTTGKPLV